MRLTTTTTTTTIWALVATAQLLLPPRYSAALDQGPTEKHWLGRLDWSSPRNWRDQRLPEDGDRLIFPVEMRHAVGMPRHGSGAELELLGLELPRDGIVALPEDGKIALLEASSDATGDDDETHDHRPPRESHWLPDQPFFWVDPLNWNSSSASSSLSEAVPHLERLPCRGDVVVLPASTDSFSLRLPATRDVEVLAVRLEDANYSLPSWEWRHALGDGDEFTGSGYTVKYSPQMGCQDCNCQDGDLAEYWEEICNVQRPRCGIPECEYPLKVEGHCCHYCGARIRLPRGRRWNTARRVARAVLGGDGRRGAAAAADASGIDWHARRTWDGAENEILVTERGRYGGVAAAIALAELEAALEEEGVEVISSETSGGPMYDYRLAVALGPFLGGFLVLLVLLLVLFPTFGYKYSQVWWACREIVDALRPSRRGGANAPRMSRKPFAFAFARFENVREDEEEGGEDGPPGGSVRLHRKRAEVDDDDDSGRTAETFENPLFSGSSEEMGKMQQLGGPSGSVSFTALERASEVGEESADDGMESIELEVGRTTV